MRCRSYRVLATSPNPLPLFFWVSGWLVSRSAEDDAEFEHDGKRAELTVNPEGELVWCAAEAHQHIAKLARESQSEGDDANAGSEESHPE